MRYALIVFAITLIWGCKSDPSGAMLSQVDELVVQVDSASVELSQYSAGPLQPLMDTISFDVKFIHQEYQDTLSLAMATKIDVYYRLMKSINKYTDAYEGQMKDLDYTKKQLNDLRTDINNGVVDTTGFGVYFQKEKEAVDRLNESTFGLKSWYKNIDKNYSNLKTPIDSFIAVIKEQRGY